MKQAFTALLRVTEPAVHEEDLAEHGFEFAAAAVVGVDRLDYRSLIS